MGCWVIRLLGSSGALGQVPDEGDHIELAACQDYRVMGLLISMIIKLSKVEGLMYVGGSRLLGLLRLLRLLEYCSGL